jgi:riboflavin kinase/FMN adenylyltransferase
MPNERVEHEGQGAGDQAGTIVTIGNFDGVHRGHQRLLDLCATRANHTRLPVVAVTFDPHPRLVLAPGSSEGFLITSTDEKCEFLRQYGVSRVEVVAFNREFAQLPAEQFLDQELGARWKARVVVIGRNFAFGRGALGNTAMLTAWGRCHGIEIVVADPVVDREGIEISSTRIRRAIQVGDLARAEQLLGRPFQVRITVAAGAGRGRQMGVPTANLAIAPEHIMPPMGIYAGYAVLPDGSQAAAVASWGIRPTFGDLTQPLLEVHVIDRTADLNHRPLWFAFKRRIRDEVPFDRIDDLVHQMDRDINLARAWYHNQYASSR